MSDKQRDLFGAIDSSQHVGYVGTSDTSKAAAVSMQEFTGELRIRVYEWACQQRDGFTSEQAQIALDLKHQTCSARVRELVKLGYVEDSGRRRPTTSGRTARVYVVTGKNHVRG